MDRFSRERPRWVRPAGNPVTYTAGRTGRYGYLPWPARKAGCEVLRRGLNHHTRDGSPTLIYPLTLAEREGFEPPGPGGPTVFKTAAFDRSATSPNSRALPAIHGATSLFNHALRPRHQCRIIPRGADEGEPCSSALHCPCSAGAQPARPCAGARDCSGIAHPRRMPQCMLTTRPGLITCKCHCLFPARQLNCA